MCLAARLPGKFRNPKFVRLIETGLVVDTTRPDSIIAEAFCKLRPGETLCGSLESGPALIGMSGRDLGAGPPCLAPAAGAWGAKP